VRALFEHAGPGIIDDVLVNVEEIATCLKAEYAREGACPVEADIEAILSLGVNVVPARMISETNWVRHDTERLAKLVLSIVERRRGHGVKPEEELPEENG
jgi:hypothetical protein